MIDSFGDLTSFGAYGFVLAVLVIGIFLFVRGFLKLLQRKEEDMMKLLRAERDENARLISKLMETHEASNKATFELTTAIQDLRKNMSLERDQIVQEIKASEKNVIQHIDKRLSPKQREQ